MRFKAIEHNGRWLLAYLIADVGGIQQTITVRGATGDQEHIERAAEFLNSGKLAVEEYDRGGWVRLVVDGGWRAVGRFVKNQPRIVGATVYTTDKSEWFTSSDSAKYWIMASHALRATATASV